MTNQELLTKLESSHALQSQAILELRELVRNEGRFTTKAKGDLALSAHERIGRMQKVEDELEDYRSLVKDDTKERVL